MSNIVIIGFATEGRTDIRFLGNVIERTFEDIAFECLKELEIHSVQHIPTQKENFVAETVNAAKESNKRGVMVLCVHTDADRRSDSAAFEERIAPAFQAVKNTDGEICKNLIPIVPIQMTEAWMLADPERLKEEIGTDKSLLDLKLNRTPEDIADPKKVIKDSLHIAFEDQTRRKRKRSLGIAELYLPMGQKVDLQKLSRLSSYQKFREGVREAYRKLGYLP